MSQRSDAFVAAYRSAFMSMKSSRVLIKLATAFLATKPVELSSAQQEELNSYLVIQAIVLPDNDPDRAVFRALNAELMAVTPTDAAAVDAEEKARIAKAQARQRLMKAEDKRAVERHRQKRIKAGLSPSAGTGKPGKKVTLYGAAKEKIKLAKSGKSTAANIRQASRQMAERELARLPLGASRFGGLPDLPVNVEWPSYKKKKLPFIAQLDLSAIATGGPLPRTGWLYVFGLYDAKPKRNPSPFVVMLHRCSREKLVRATQPRKSQMWADAGVTTYAVLPIAPGRRGEPAGWLFGSTADRCDKPGELADEAMLGGDDWINLLAIQSNDSPADQMLWSDSGHLYILIRRRDLKRGDFSNVFAVVCSS